MEKRIPDVELCVVVVNYYTPGAVLDCLETLLPQLRELGATMALVDNASPDDSLSQLDRWIREVRADDCVRLIESSDNGGFAAGSSPDSWLNTRSLSGSVIRGRSRSGRVLRAL